MVLPGTRLCDAMEDAPTNKINKNYGGTYEFREVINENPRSKQNSVKFPFGTK